MRPLYTRKKECKIVPILQNCSLQLFNYNNVKNSMNQPTLTKSSKEYKQC